MKYLPGCLILVLMLGSFLWLSWQRENVWQPKRKLRKLAELPLSGFYRWEFKPTYQAFTGELFGGAAKAPVAMVGKVHGYSVEVSFGWTDEEHYLVRVFFESPSRNYEELMQAWRAQQVLVKEWAFAKGFFKPFSLFCAPAYIDATFTYTSNPPETAELMAITKQIINELQLLHRPPLDYAAACLLANNVIQTSQRRTDVRKQAR